MVNGLHGVVAWHRRVRVWAAVLLFFEVMLLPLRWATMGFAGDVYSLQAIDFTLGDLTGTDLHAAVFEYPSLIGVAALVVIAATAWAPQRTARSIKIVAESLILLLV